MDIQTLIKTTQIELDTKRNHFNNIYDDELAVIVIKEIAVLEEKLNYYYKLTKRELIA